MDQMAKVLRRNPVDIRDVLKVHRMYNEAWREYVKFPTTGAAWEHENRLSDHDLWDSGKPALQHRGTMGDGYTELIFTFQNTNEKDSENWARSFISQYSLPYTFFDVRPSRDLRGLITFEPGESVPKYTRVIIRFEEDEVTNSRTKQLR